MFTSLFSFHPSAPQTRPLDRFSRTDFTDLNLYWINGALFVCFSFWLRVLD